MDKKILWKRYISYLGLCALIVCSTAYAGVGKQGSGIGPAPLVVEDNSRSETARPRRLVFEDGVLDYNGAHAHVTVKPNSFFDLRYLTLSQSTPQTISGGIPLMTTAVDVDGSGNQLVNKTYVDYPFSISSHYTGFPDRTSTSLSWDDGTATLTLTATADPVWINGVYYTINTLTKAFTSGLSEASGLYWFYITAPGGVPQLNYATTVTDQFGQCLVAIVYWNTTTNKGLLFDERHWFGRDKWMHEYLHETVGARYYVGLTGTFGNTSLSVTAGEFYDEDVEHKLSSDSPMAYPGTAMTTCKVLYHNGDADWKWDAASTVPYKITGAGGNLQYNNGNTLATAGANKWVNYFVLAANALSEPIYVVVGTAQYDTLAQAQNAAIPSFGTLPTPELKLLYKITYKNDGTPTYNSAIDFRTSSNLPITNFIATSHASLSNLNWSSSGHTWDADVNLGTYKLTAASLITTGGASTDFVKGDGSLDSSTYLTSVTAHNLLSSTHGDTTASTVARGDLVVGTGATPKWDNYALGAAGKILRSDGTDLLYSTLTIPDTIAAGSVFVANSANVLSALTSTSGTYYLKNVDGTISWATVSGSGASTALDNLASVAINTSLISDADSTDDLGSSGNYWANAYIDKTYTDAIEGKGDISVANDFTMGTDIDINFQSTGNTYNGGLTNVWQIYFKKYGHLFMGYGRIWQNDHQSGAYIDFDDRTLTSGKPSIVGFGEIAADELHAGDGVDLSDHFGKISATDGIVTGSNTVTTDDLTEGSTNKYFNGKTTDDLTEGSTNKYFPSGGTTDTYDDGVDVQISFTAGLATGISTPFNLNTVSNAQNIAGVLDNIDDITPMTYTYNGKTRYGFVADDFSKNFSFATFDDRHQAGEKGYRKDAVMAIMMKAIQELKARVEKLEG